MTLALLKAWGQAPPLERGLPTRRRMLTGGLKQLIVRGSEGGLQEAALPEFYSVLTSRAKLVEVLSRP